MKRSTKSRQTNNKSYRADVQNKREYTGLAPYYSLLSSKQPRIPHPLQSITDNQKDRQSNFTFKYLYKTLKRWTKRTMRVIEQMSRNRENIQGIITNNYSLLSSKQPRKSHFSRSIRDGRTD